MYIDLIVIVVLLLLVIFCFRRFSSFVYSFAIIDIFLRLLHFVEVNVRVKELQIFISKYFSDSIEAVITGYTSGIIETILMWAYAIMYAIFLSYIVKTFIHKKK